MIYCGVDPGASGAVAWLNSEDEGLETGVFKFKETEADIWDVFQVLGRQPSVFAMLEAVSAMPRQGVSSSFKFGRSYGLLRGFLIASGIPFETVSPVKWQGALRCQSKGDKRVTRAKAQELFPQMRCTHAISDALLLAEYCRRVRTFEITAVNK